MNLWLLIGIVCIVKIFSVVIVSYGTEKENWGLLVLWTIAGLSFSVLWLLPTVFNSIFIHLGLDVVYTWKELLPVSVLLGIYFSSTNNNKK